MNVKDLYDATYLNAGIALMGAVRNNETGAPMTLPLTLRPSFIVKVTKMFESMLKADVSEEEKQQFLTEGIGAFFSEVLELGILRRATEISKGLEKEEGK